VIPFMSVGIGADRFRSFGLSAISDVPGRPDISIGHAPGLPIFIQVDNPDDVVVTMSRFHEIRDTFSGRAVPAWPSDDHTHQWRIQLQHALQDIKGDAKRTIVREMVETKLAAQTYLRLAEPLELTPVPNFDSCRINSRALVIACPSASLLKYAHTRLGLHSRIRFAHTASSSLA